jgi:hypothetical protein
VISITFLLPEKHVCYLGFLGSMAASVQSRLRVTRRQILAFRRRVGALDERMPKGSKSLRRAAWAGLQDSMPRAALLSLHARVEGATADSEFVVYIAERR